MLKSTEENDDEGIESFQQTFQFFDFRSRFGLYWRRGFGDCIGVFKRFGECWRCYIYWFISNRFWFRIKCYLVYFDWNNSFSFEYSPLFGNEEKIRKTQ